MIDLELSAYIGKGETAGGYDFGSGLAPTRFDPASAAYDDGAWWQTQYSAGGCLDVLYGSGNVAASNPPLLNLAVTPTKSEFSLYHPGDGNEYLKTTLDATKVQFAMQAKVGQADPLVELRDASGTVVFVVRPDGTYGAP